MNEADKIQWALGASIGRKFSKQFALNKQAQRVDYDESQQPAVPDSTDTGDNGNGNQGGTETPGELNP